MAIGQDLLDLPFAEMVRNLAFAIAEGQLALDRSSIETLQFLANNTVNLIPEVIEVIERTTGQSVTIPAPTGTGTTSLPIDGVQVRQETSAPVPVTLLQAGLTPTFYQFTEAQIEVKISITMRRGEDDNSNGNRQVKVPGFATRAFASSVNYRTSNTYSYTAQGSSVLRATIRPVPPPARLVPRTVTVNTLTNPPTVTTTEG
jgi:hypothetical protein